MSGLLVFFDSEYKCADRLRHIRWHNCTACPHCQSYNVKKDGRYRSYQKYYCKYCRKSFNDKTGTVFHYSHSPLRIWFLVLYLCFSIWPGCSIREISLEGSIPYRKCYRFIRTVMEKLASLSNTNVKLKDTVESDEFYIKAGLLKGRPYHEEIIKIGRKPRRRGLKPWKGRGTFQKDHPMITCIHQRNGMTYFDVPIKQSLVDVVCTNVGYGSMIYTDEYLPYGKLEEHGFVHEQVNHSKKEYARGDVHVNNCECRRSNLYQLWIKKFMGVNKHNLQTYSKAFQFIHNLRSVEDRKERFRLILC
jgi:transposase-like protein